jgi:hypothetical protein
MSAIIQKGKRITKLGRVRTSFGNGVWDVFMEVTEATGLDAKILLREPGTRYPVLQFAHQPDGPDGQPPRDWWTIDGPHASGDIISIMTIVNRNE